MLKYKLSKIDALILTHPHADAYLGLDDIREWTETKPLTVHVRDSDYEQIARTFPYLANRDKATGSGYVAQLNWAKFSTGTPFMVEGLRVTPYLVGHGKNCTGARPKYRRAWLILFFICSCLLRI
jgi:phosphoribosyl 1,2-cyclic phosphodiesterase